MNDHDAARANAKLWLEDHAAACACDCCNLLRCYLELDGEAKRLREAVATYFAKWRDAVLGEGAEPDATGGEDG